jgi:predicted  nucleic acid-binding Zn-ribbon protein
MSKKVTIDLDALTSEMDALKMEKARLNFELNNISKEIEKRELQLLALMSQMDVKEMQHGI